MKRILFVVMSLMVLAQPSFAARTSVSRQFPIYDNGGKPDLVSDPQRFESQMEIIDRRFDPGDCAIDEGAVGGSGYRRLLRFDTVLMNAGDGDLVVGDRADPDNPYADQFVFHVCHGHYHIKDFSSYELLTPDGTLVVAGYKQGFCLEDSLKYDSKENRSFTCAFQGVTSGWGDWYFKQLVGQWIDITGIPQGDYIVRATINASGVFDEGENRHPNAVQTSIHVPDPRNKVTVDNSPAATEE